MLGLLTAGVAGWLAFGRPGSDDDDWRAAVVDYMKLYTNDTFAFISPDRQAGAFELSAVAKKVGADLTPESVTLPGLDFKVAFNLAYDGKPLGEIAYVDFDRRPGPLLRHRQRGRRRAAALRKAR